MKCVLQRVLSAQVMVEGEVLGEIGRGILILAGVEKLDDERVMESAAKKIVSLRMFSDANDKMNLDLKEAGGAILAVSQFTLAGSIDKGRRPGFDNAAPPERAKELFDHFVEAMRREDVEVQTGRFRAMMQVALVNDGPVTFTLNHSLKAVEPDA